jgi:hypothetical protein
MMITLQLINGREGRGPSCGPIFTTSHDDPCSFCEGKILRRSNCPPHHRIQAGSWGYYTMCIRGCFAESNTERRAADHSPWSNAEVKNAWSEMSTHPWVFVAWCLNELYGCVITLRTKESFRVCAVGGKCSDYTRLFHSPGDSTNDVSANIYYIPPSRWTGCAARWFPRLSRISVSCYTSWRRNYVPSYQLQSTFSKTIL